MIIELPIDTPGIYTIPAEVYHRDPCREPSLNASIARLLCADSPLHAWTAHPRLNPDVEPLDNEAADIGTAAHALLLEGLANVVIIDAKDFRTNAAKAERDAARAAGKTPILAGRWRDIENMFAAARMQLAKHTDGGADMFTGGHAEQTLVWTEDVCGTPVWCRARLDYLRPGAIDDYKTVSQSANPDVVTRSLFASGWDVQASFYLRGLRAVLGVDDAIFRFAVQETHPPYALSVIGLGPDALTIGEKKCLYALDCWRQCVTRGDWPGYPTRTCYATLPAWVEAQWLEKESR